MRLAFLFFCGLAGSLVGYAFGFFCKARLFPRNGLRFLFGFQRFSFGLGFGVGEGGGFRGFDPRSFCGFGV